MQIRRHQLHNLNDFQRLLGHIFQIWSTIGIKSDDLFNLKKTLDDEEDLNNSGKLSVEGEKELALKEEKFQKPQVNHVYLKLKYILVILSSKHSPTGILIERKTYLRIDLYYHINQGKN